MTSSVRVTFREAGYTALTRDIDRNVARVAGVVRDRARKIIRDEGRINTGALAQSIEVKRLKWGQSEVTYEVGSRLKYAGFQHEGVEGPILPRRAKVLRFKPSGSNEFVFRRSVKGFKGIKFMERALDSVTASDFRQTG